MSKFDYKAAVDGKNLAEDLTDEELLKIGNDVVEGFNNDKFTRREWEDDYEKNIELAMQVAHEKSYPWPRASNVKFPLLSTAALQFNARAYPSLIPSDGRVVNCRVVGADPDGMKFERSRRISAHMSYQFLEEIPEWEEDMDKLLLVLPIIGICFKKTYRDTDKDVNVSKLILPDDLVVAYHTKSFDTAERVSEIIYKTKRALKECQLSNYYLDIELGDPTGDDPHKDANVHKEQKGANDSTTPYVLIQQHHFLDLDDDGYPEPYITTVDWQTRKVLRINARYELDGIKTDEKGNVIRIVPTQYYTKYGFIPNPDGSFYDIGFGKLLGPLNHSVDTIINQLVDSGTLNNLQSGFIGKGLRIRMGETKFSPGEWKAVNSTADDLKKQIFPLPTKEPSPVLFQLLGLLIQSVKELASVAEIMVGKMPGQNTPAYTTQQTVEQGMKLFTAVYKRVYRSLKEEFRKVYLLNRTYLDTQEEVAVLDEPIRQSDYQEGSPDDIIPAADPSTSSQTEKVAKAQQLASMMQLGTLDPMQITMELLKAMEIEQPERFINKQPPPPDPKIVAAQQKAENDKQKVQLEMYKTHMELALQQQQQVFDQKMEAQSKQLELIFQTIKGQLEVQGINAKANAAMQTSQAQHEQGMQQQADQHAMSMATTQQTHEQKLKQMKETPAPKGGKESK